MNTEKKVIKPFDGLEKLEKIASKIELIVSQPNKKPERLNSKNGRTFNSEFSSHRSLGLTLEFVDYRDEIKEALTEIDLTSKEVAVLAVFDSPFLRNREVRELGDCSQLPDSIELVAKGGKRSVVLEDRRHSFDVKVCFVLGDERKPKPLAPYRKGSLLAETEFTIRPLPEGDGLSPRPLNESTRDRLKLPSSTELCVEVEGSLLDLESFEEDFNIWWNEDLYNVCAKLSNDLRAQYVKTILNSALIQIVYLVSSELKETEKEIEELEKNPPMIIEVLHSVYKESNAANLIKGSSFLSTLKARPELIAAVLSGHDGYVNAWKSLFEPDEDAEESES